MPALFPVTIIRLLTDASCWYNIMLSRLVCVVFFFFFLDRVWPSLIFTLRSSQRIIDIGIYSAFLVTKPQSYYMDCYVQQIHNLSLCSRTQFATAVLAHVSILTVSFIP